MSSPQFPTVEEYFTSINRNQAETLSAVIDFVLAEFEDLEVKTAWNVPQIHRGGNYVLGLSAQKNHLSLAPWSAAIIESFTPRLQNGGYVVKKNLFRIPNDWPIDEALVRDLVRARREELDKDS